MKNLLPVSLLVLAGFIAGMYIPAYFQTENLQDTKPATGQTLSYTCSMHPSIHAEHKGSCPICGMDLVAAKIPQQPSSHQQISISHVMQNNLGIKTARVTRRTIYRPIHSYGYIKQLEQLGTQKVTAPVDAKVIKVLSPDVNADVKKGEQLLLLSSATWLTMQEQLLNAIQQGNLNEIRQLSSLLKQSGMSLAEIQKLKVNKKTIEHIIIRAQKNGQLSKLNVKNNQSVKRGEVLLEIAPLYPIITYAEMFEGQWQWLKPGQPALMHMRSVPGVEWTGVVQSVDDIVASRSRTLKSRIGFKLQPGIELRSGMQTSITILSDPQKNVLSVPYDSVIRTGIENRVIVLDDNGHFFPQKVTIGLSDNTYVEIKSGLKENQKVVASGQFLLDSESNLLNELSRMQSGEVSTSSH